MLHKLFSLCQIVCNASKNIYVLSFLSMWTVLLELLVKRAFLNFVPALSCKDAAVANTRNPRSF